MSPFSAIDYRRYAAECVRLAQSTSDPADKARLLDMAETFSELADKSETRSPGNPEADRLLPLCGCLFFAASTADYFRDFRRLGFNALGFSGGVATRHIMSSSIIPESRRCRTRARECRTMAERLRVQTARDQMLKAASDFERMAQDAERREIAQGLTQLKAFAITQHPRASGRQSG